MILRPCVSFLFAASLLTLGACNSSRHAKPADDAADWTMYGRSYDEQRFSPLTQINEQNVAKLGLLWSREFGTTRGLEATPLVLNGVIYTTGEWSVAYALDARTGEILWTYDPKVPRARARSICCDVVNRGVALYHGNVYVGTLDGRLIALDAKSGIPIWDVVTVDQSKPYAITGAPRIARGMVLIGNAGSEFGVRGYISAYDAETGKLVWRTFTVPGDPSRGFESKALETAAKTWHGNWWVAGGGGTPWDSIVYDPELDLVYTGTGNGTAWYRDLRSPGGGDNLYLASILALRASDGQLVWHFQTVPGDNWDYDATQPLMLADLPIDGSTREVIMQASKNGFFYTLDRQTGQFISAKPFVNKITWASGIDPKSGRPIESLTAHDGLNPVLVSPAPDGAHNWYPMAFHPNTGLMYVPAREGSVFLHVPDKGWKSNPALVNIGNDPRYEGPLLAKLLAAPPATGHLIAWNPVEQREAWRVSHRGERRRARHRWKPRFSRPWGRRALRLSRHRRHEAVGVQRWHRHHGPARHLRRWRSPIPYPDGRMGRRRRSNQYSWDGSVQARLRPRPHLRRWRQRKTGSSHLWSYGATLARDPHECHAGDRPRRRAPLWNPLLELPRHQRCAGRRHSRPPLRLRRNPPAIRVHRPRRHSRIPRGMPSFKDALKPAQVRAIQAYVLSRAAASAAPPAGKVAATPSQAAGTPH